MKTTTVLARALLLTLGLTACSAATSPTAGVAVRTATHTAANDVPSTSGTPSTVATRARSTASTNGGQGKVPADSARRGRCVSSVLRASLGQSQGAAGHSYVAILLTNRGRISCTLTGYPGVSFTAGASAHQIGAPAERDRRFPVVGVTLAPGATVHATVAIDNYANYDRPACLPAPATGYRIYPPGSTGSLLVRAPQTVCSRSGIQTFYTSIVRPGTSPD